MPKFLYTIAAISITSWIYWIKLLTKTAPTSPKNIALFLITLFIALFATLSLPIYYFMQRKIEEFSNLRKTYRKALKLSLLITIPVIGVMSLKAFGILTLLNGLLFVSLYAMIALPKGKTR